jgi:hypothetical protein
MLSRPSGRPSTLKSRDRHIEKLEAERVAGKARTNEGGLAVMDADVADKADPVIEKDFDSKGYDSATVTGSTTALQVERAQTRTVSTRMLLV